MGGSAGASWGTGHLHKQNQKVKTTISFLLSVSFDWRCGAMSITAAGPPPLTNEMPSRRAGQRASLPTRTAPRWTKRPRGRQRHHPRPRTDPTPRSAAMGLRGCCCCCAGGCVAGRAWSAPQRRDRGRGGVLLDKPGALQAQGAVPCPAGAVPRQARRRRPQAGRQTGREGALSGPPNGRPGPSSGTAATPQRATTITPTVGCPPREY